MFLLLLGFFTNVCPKWGWDDNLRRFLLMLLGGGDGEIKKEGKKKFITREQEPEQ